MISLKDKLIGQMVDLEDLNVARNFASSENSRFGIEVQNYIKVSNQKTFSIPRQKESDLIR